MGSQLVPPASTAIVVTVQLNSFRLTGLSPPTAATFSEKEMASKSFSTEGATKSKGGVYWPRVPKQLDSRNSNDFGM